MPTGATAAPGAPLGEPVPVGDPLGVADDEPLGVADDEVLGVADDEVLGVTDDSSVGEEVPVGESVADGAPLSPGAFGALDNGPNVGSPVNAPGMIVEVVVGPPAGDVG
ncbi:hypothetical protein, partial [Frankia sp. AvcI1]